MHIVKKDLHYFYRYSDTTKKVVLRIGSLCRLRDLLEESVKTFNRCHFNDLWSWCYETVFFNVLIPWEQDKELVITIHRFQVRCRNRPNSIASLKPFYLLLRTKEDRYKISGNIYQISRWNRSERTSSTSLQVKISVHGFWSRYWVNSKIIYLFEDI